MSSTVAVIDYGMGNLHSVVTGLEKESDTNQKIILTSNVEEAAQAERIVVPGVGAMKDCMDGLRNAGFDEALNEWRHSKPIFGICMGMHVMMRGSEEGCESGETEAGLNWFSGDVQRLSGFSGFDQSLKIPHMGWNKVEQTVSHPIWDGIDSGAFFYHVHSFGVGHYDPSYTLGMCEYGVPFATAVGSENIVGVQFHPEKSAKDGLRMLHNFLRWKP